MDMGIIILRILQILQMMDGQIIIITIIMVGVIITQTMDGDPISFKYI